MPPKGERRWLRQFPYAVEACHWPRQGAVFDEAFEGFRTIRCEHVVGVFAAVRPVYEMKSGGAEKANRVGAEGEAGTVAIATPDKLLRPVKPARSASSTYS